MELIHCSPNEICLGPAVFLHYREVVLSSEVEGINMIAYVLYYDYGKGSEWEVGGEDGEGRRERPEGAY